MSKLFCITVLILLAQCVVAFPSNALSEEGSHCASIASMNEGLTGKKLIETSEFQKVSKSNYNRPLVFIDLDNTIGNQDEATHQWVVYKNVFQSLKKLEKKFTLILLTGNVRAHVCDLFKQKPQISKYFKRVITADDFAPHFARAIMNHDKMVLLGRAHGGSDYVKELFEFFKETPAQFIPEGTVLGYSDDGIRKMNYDEWYEKIYNPIVAPNKAPVVGSALLIDDEFGRPKPSLKYAVMMNEGRAIFAGRRGGETAAEAPDWNGIVVKTLSKAVGIKK